MRTSEPRAAYLDCSAGVAGDMLLGALLDAGADPDAVQAAIDALAVPGLGLHIEQARRGGLRCTRARVSAVVRDQPTRGLMEVLARIDAAGLRPAAAALAARTFRLLARAEATVHAITVEQVHFHEVGAADAMADVVGTAVAAEHLGLLAGTARLTCSALAAGSGTTTSAHGRLPVPAPAVLEIVAGAGLALSGGELTGECTTPTGAALVAALAEPGPVPAMTVEVIGSGAGARDTPDRPNITRVLVGRHADSAVGATPRAPGRTESVTLVEATVDDLNPELWPAVLAAVRAAGAWDCWTTAVVGRHSRPGQVLTALCAEQLRPSVVDAVLRHSTTLGVRWARWQRSTLPRTSVRVRIGPAENAQDITVKVTARPGAERTAKPELADAQRAAQALGWPLRRVCEHALAAYHQAYPNGDAPGWLA